MCGMQKRVYLPIHYLRKTNSIICVPCEKENAGLSVIDGPGKKVPLSRNNMKNDIATLWRRGKAIYYALTRTIYFKENTYFEFSVSR